MRKSMRHVLLIALVPVCLVTFSCRIKRMRDRNAIEGSGILKTESRDVTSFSVINQSGIGHITVKQTGKESLTISAEDNLLPYISAKVEDHSLVIGVTPKKNLRPTKPI